MYDSNEEQDSSALKNAPDIKKKANLVIWSYFVFFGLALWGMIYLVDIYFRIQSDKEYDVKIGSVVSKELIEHRQLEQGVLEGKRGVLEGKKNISIDNAIAKVMDVIK